MTEQFEASLSHHHSDEAIFFLMTIESDQLEEPLYLVNNNEAVVSRGKTYEPFPFDLALPPDTGGMPQALKLNSYNLGEQMMDLIRQTTVPPQIKFEIVSTIDLDEVEKTIDFMEVKSAEYDAIGVSFSLAPSNWGARKTLEATYDQTEFPGLFFALQ